MPNTMSAASHPLAALSVERDHLAIRRARGERDGAVQAAAAAAHVALGRPRHPADAHERRTVDRMHGNARNVRGPRVGIDAKMQRGDARQHGKHAVDRTEVPAPDALAAAVDEADADGRERRAAQHEQRRGGILIDADELAEHRRQRERDERPSAPFQPARHREAEPMPAGGLGQRALGTEEAAPRAPDDEHRQDDERPPHAPEQPLRQDREAVVPARVVRRQRQEGRHDDEERIGGRRSPTASRRRRAHVAAAIRPRRESARPSAAVAGRRVTRPRHSRRSRRTASPRRVGAAA